MSTKAELVKENEKLKDQRRKLTDAIMYFVKRVEKGSILSKKTYKKYIDLIHELDEEG